MATPPRESVRMFNRVAKTLMAESDRGAVLVGAAFVDAALEESLRASLKPEGRRAQAAWDSLLGKRGPLSSTWTRKQMALAMGLIDEEIDEALDVIRLLRNHFAHSHSAVSLGDVTSWKAIRRLETLAKAWTTAADRKQLRKLLPVGTKAKRAVRSRASFVSSVAYLAGYLHGGTEARKQANLRLKPRPAGTSAP